MSRMKPLFKLALIFCLVFLISFGLGASVRGLILPAADDENENQAEVTIPEGERTNILLLGTDARPGETQTRTDTIILASIDPKLDKVALVSIPRDTQIKIKGSYVDKINGANVVGGPELVVEKVEELVGENINYYVEMDFEGFKKIIDTIGGVNLNVDQRMYKPSEDIDLQAGQQLLNGRQALAFVRFRDYALGDIERAEHQQIFLKALGNELLKGKNIIKLPSLVKTINKNIDTNLRMADMLKIASWAPGFNKDSVIAQTLPGYFLDKRDDYGNLIQSYWVADQKKTAGLLEKMLAGQTVAVISDTPVTYSPPQQSTNKDKTEDKSEVKTGDKVGGGIEEKVGDKAQVKNKGEIKDKAKDESIDIIVNGDEESRSDKADKDNTVEELVGERNRLPSIEQGSKLKV